jgi:carboxyl-terminal processing protease
LGARVAVIFLEGPAYRAGLREGDLITAVDGKTVSGTANDEIVTKIRGPEGTSVTLTIVRAGEPKPRTIRIVREQVVAPTVESKLLPGSAIGYVEVSIFSQPTGEQFERSLRDLETKGMKGLIIDLRGNPGGLLDSAVDLLSRFVEDKVVVKMRLKDGREEVARSPSGGKHALQYPIVVLLDEDSASAAEIFAGVLRDYKLATLVGEHSYGKASVQNVFQLIDGAGAKITIAKYFLPSGQDISRKVDEDGQYLSGGLAPHVEAELDFNLDPLLGDPARDSQLKKAIEVIQQKIGDSAAVHAATTTGAHSSAA